MARRIDESYEAGSDSFMDVVSNVVGILIVLVMVVGTRVRNAVVAARESQTAAAAPAGDDSQEASRLQTQSVHLATEIRDVSQALAGVQRRLATARQERAQIGALIRTVELELDAERGKMDASQREALDLARQLAAARSRREELDRRRASLLTQSTPEVKQVVSYPTPLSKTVETREEHYRLRGQRLVRVPVDELADKLIADRRQLVWQLRDLPEVAGVIGPIDGFKLQYRIVRTGNTAELEGVFQPVGADLGEPVEVALAAGSAFRQRLSRLDRVTTTITVWTYPDSFAEFRALKKELYQMGFAVAARPMDHDMPIGMSPRGSKSAAE